MAIGSSTSSPPLSDVALGLRGAVALGSGLRGGVVLVNRAVERTAALNEERRLAEEAAVEALEEQTRLERQEAEAKAAGNAEPGADPPADLPHEDDEATRQAVGAAGAAGQAGDVLPRGAFLDVSV